MIPKDLIYIDEASSFREAIWLAKKILLENNLNLVVDESEFEKYKVLNIAIFNGDPENQDYAAEFKAYVHNLLGSVSISRYFFDDYLDFIYLLTDPTKQKLMPLSTMIMERKSYPKKEN